MTSTKCRLLAWGKPTGYIFSAPAAMRCKDCTLLTLLHDYLRFLGSARHIDDEKLFLLGLELKNVWPRQFQEELALSMRENIESKIAGIFLSGLGITWESESNAVAHRQIPSDGELKNLLSQLKDRSFRSIQSSVRDFWRKHIAYTEHTGDARPLAFTVGKIGEAILRMSAKDRQQGAGLVRELVCAALRWEPWNDYFWNLWARAFLAQDAHEAAEFVYWEGIRRFPGSSHARNQLVGLLQRLVA